MISRITADLSEEDRSTFRRWFIAEISRKYPLSTGITADWLLNVTQSERDRAGYFTLRKCLWKAESASGEPLGFTVATEKRGGSIKFGPSLVAGEYRNRGIGRTLRLAVEGHYSARGFRKAYSTTNLKNAPGIYYLTGAGYSIEAHLRSHYQVGVDEVILGKLLKKQQLPEFQDGEPSSALLQRLRPYYDGLDSLFEENIFRASGVDADLSDEAFYIAKKKVVFGDPRGNFCVSTPKREGVVKLGPLLALDERGLGSLTQEVIKFYSARRGARKLFCVSPLEETWVMRELRSTGWYLEGVLREPYRPGCDMVILSLFLEEDSREEP